MANRALIWFDLRRADASLALRHWRRRLLIWVWNRVVHPLHDRLLVSLLAAARRGEISLGEVDGVAGLNSPELEDRYSYERTER